MTKVCILDYGSGFEPKVAYAIYQKLRKAGVKKIQFDCYDLYKNYNLKDFNRTKFIKFYKISSLRSKKKYDFCLINDVFHHIGIHRKLYLKKILVQLNHERQIVSEPHPLDQPSPESPHRFLL